MELEALFEKSRPSEARTVFESVPEGPRVLIHADDFALLRSHYPDKVRVLTAPVFTSRHVLGEIPRLEDGSLTVTYLVVRRDALRGSPSILEHPLP